MKHLFCLLLCFQLSDCLAQRGLRAEDITTSALIVSPDPRNGRVVPLEGTVARKLIDEAHLLREKAKKQWPGLQSVLSADAEALNRYSESQKKDPNARVKTFTTVLDGLEVRINFAGHFPDRGELEWTSFKDGVHLNTFTIELSSIEITRATDANVDSAWQQDKLRQVVVFDRDKGTVSWVSFDTSGNIKSIGKSLDPLRGAFF